MSTPDLSPQALNKAMLEAVEFIHAEGWDASPTLFALVPSSLLADQLTDAEDSPLTLVVQDNLPQNLEAGSEALADYVSRLAWPAEIAGVVLAQEITFRDTTGDAQPQPARLFSGVLRSEAELTLLQIRPTDEELAERGPFAEDEIELRGGPTVAPGVIAALRYGLEQDPAEFDVD
ncbi:PPA1309 family protein [Corynebacterium halotolerans]|uniref:PPA1309 family protein n=1 Tax=Corynebacterium halotolerans TaxID=225326 RepID=UPI003CF35DE1